MKYIILIMLLCSGCATAKSEYYRGCMDGVNSLPDSVVFGSDDYCERLDRKAHPPVPHGRGGA